MEILIRMHARLLRRRPTSRIHTRRDLPRILPTPPLNQQRNRILCLRRTPDPLRNAHTRRRSHPHRRIARHHTLADIDMMRVEVIRDITLPPGPRLKRLELTLRLAHVTVEVIEVAEGAGFRARVCVRRVEALVVLDEDEDAVFAGFGEQAEVVG